MTQVIGLNCLYNGTLIEIPFSEKDEVDVSDKVIFKDAENNEEFGIVLYVNREAADESEVISGSKILRKATPNDVQKVENFLERSDDALRICKKYVQKYELQMQPFRAAYSFDGDRVHFMFTAEERVDFRDLVKDLAKNLQKQIHLRQIGPRDKAKIVDGYGRCGRRFCCSTFLPRLESINMEMVRYQGLESKGSSKLSGACGKLLCCLKFEVDQYREMRILLPQIGDAVKLKKSSTYSGAEGTIVALDVLNQKLKVDIKNEGFAIIENKEIDKVIPYSN